MVVKEASACQAVPIGTRHGGIPEIIEDAQTGFLVPERDTEAMADRLSMLLRDRALRERLGAAGARKMAREYDNLHSVDALEGLYDEARSLHSAARRSPERLAALTNGTPRSG
jgi:colanic acid/amylovoran biosynthesis glycosyltransferase